MLSTSRSFELASAEREREIERERERERERNRERNGIRFSNTAQGHYQPPGREEEGRMGGECSSTVLLE